MESWILKKPPALCDSDLRLHTVLHVHQGFGKPLEDSRKLRHIRAMTSLLSRIPSEPDICHGKPAIRHLRYQVESRLKYLAAGNAFEGLLKEFPSLVCENLQACLGLAAQSLKLNSQHLALA